MSTAKERLEAEKERIRMRMAGPLYKYDQTNLQPVVWLCPNPECSEAFGNLFAFISDYPKCPKCSCGPPAITKQVLIHYIAKNKKGKIGAEGGIRYSIACDHSRDYIATTTNGEAGSGDFSAVNCPGCMCSAAYKKQITFGSPITM